VQVKSAREHFVAGDCLAQLGVERSMADPTGQADPEHLEQPAQLVLKIDALLEDGLAAGQ
jgi:hypothetical protein